VRKYFQFFLVIVLLFCCKASFADELSDAITGNDVAILKKMLQEKPSLIETPNKHGELPLHIAASSGAMESVKLLISLGANVNAKEPQSGATPLHMACMMGHKDVVEFLINNKADVNAKSAIGTTPLHIAAYQGYEDVVAVLMAHGADTNAKTRSGLTPLEWANQQNHKEIAQMLQSPAEEVAVNKPKAEPKVEVKQPAAEIPKDTNKAKEDTASLLPPAEQIQKTPEKPSPPPKSESRMEVKMTETDQKLVELLARLQAASTAISNLENELNTTRKELAVAKHEKESTSAELLSQISVLKQKLGDTENQLAEQKEKFAESVKIISDSQGKELASATNRVADLTLQIAKLEKELSSTQQSLENEKKDKAASMTAFQTKIDALEMELSKANMKKEEVEQRIAEKVKTAMEQKEKDFEKERAKLEKADELIKDLERKLAVAEEAALNMGKKHKEEIENAKFQIARLEFELKTSSANADRLQADLDKMQKESDLRVKQEASKYEEEIKKLKEKVSSYELQLEIAATNVAVTAANAKRLQDELERIQTQMNRELAKESAVRENLEKTLADREQIISDLNSKLKTANQRMSKFEKDMKYYSEECQRLQQELDKQSKNRGTEKARPIFKNQSQEQFVTELTAKLETSENELKRVKDETQSLNESYKALQKELARYVALLNEKDKALLSKEDELKDLSNKLTEAELKRKEAEQKLKNNGALTSTSVDQSVSEVGTRIVQLAMNLKETIITDQQKATSAVLQAGSSNVPNQLSTEIIVKQTASTSTSRGEALLLKKEQGMVVAPIESAALAVTTTPQKVIEKLTADIPDMLQQIHTTVVCQIRLYNKEQTQYLLNQPPGIQKTAPDVVFMTANFGNYTEFGFKPLRHIFWVGKGNNNSLYDGDIENFIAELTRINQNKGETTTYVPSLIITPRYFWSGSFGQFNLSCMNKGRKLLVLNTNDPKKIGAIPLVSGFLKERYILWRYLTRISLLLSLLILAGLFFVPKIIAKRSNYSASELYRAYSVVLLLPALCATILINFMAYRNPKFDIYAPDNPQIFEQNVLNALENMDLAAFWFHPDQSDTSEHSIMGVPYRAHTDPYPDLIRLCRAHRGFMGACHLDNCIAMPGGQWDVALIDFIKGKSEQAIWCFADINDETHSSMKSSEAVVWSKTKEIPEIVKAIKDGHFYVRYNSALQKLQLDKWQIGNNGMSGHIVQTLDDGVDIHIAISSTLPGETVDVWLIRSGELIARKTQTTPCSFTLRDYSIEHGGLSYYRLIVNGRNDLKLISNPIFVNFFKKQENENKKINNQ
jgi:hypothetical protein